MNYLIRFPALSVVALLLFTGCYTQLETIHPERAYRPAPKEHIDQRRDAAVDRRLSEYDGEEGDYLYGYEEGVYDGFVDGWTEAEAYYFLDYDTRDWYYQNRYRPLHRHYYSFYGYGYPYHPYAYHNPWYGHHRFQFSIAFGTGFWHDPWYSPWGPHYYDFYSPYAYYRYPVYGYGAPYYGHPFYHARFYVDYTHIQVQPRTYAARSTGMSGSGLTNRTNRGERVSATGSSIRSTGRSGTAVRSSSATVNRSGSVERQRSSGSVNRSPANVERQRSSGSVNRSPANVERQRSSGSVNRSPANVERQRSSGSVTQIGRAQD